MTSNKSSAQSRKRKASASTSNARPTTTTTRTKSTGPYDRNFAQFLEDGNIYPPMYRYTDNSAPPRPENWDRIKERMAQPRPSLSPSRFSDNEFQIFEQIDADVAKEMQVRERVIPVIEGTIPNDKCRAGSIPFNNLAPLITDANLVPGNPDIYYGARPGQLDRRIRDELSDQIIPSTQHDLPMAPNFFVAAKGPDGTPAVASRQACYDGALGARGMHTLASYGRNSRHNTASTITSTYQSGTLKMYVSHVVVNNEGSPEYHMSQLNAWSMTGNAKAFREGATAFRNARDWAQEQRDELIEGANEMAQDAGSDRVGNVQDLDDLISPQPGSETRHTRNRPKQTRSQRKRCKK
ncbi:MAG: hypothetical protein MMC23_009427 [Stictis urceolatum]|nr:hypothetical protein [Stictis urceolata]